jgi:hypothetical protein
VPTLAGAPFGDAVVSIDRSVNALHENIDVATAIDDHLPEDLQGLDGPLAGVVRSPWSTQRTLLEGGPARSWANTATAWSNASSSPASSAIRFELARSNTRPDPPHLRCRWWAPMVVDEPNHNFARRSSSACAIYTRRAQ